MRLAELVELTAVKLRRASDCDGLVQCRAHTLLATSGTPDTAAGQEGGRRSGRGDAGASQILPHDSTALLHSSWEALCRYVTDAECAFGEIALRG